MVHSRRRPSSSWTRDVWPMALSTRPNRQLSRSTSICKSPSEVSAAMTVRYREVSPLPDTRSPAAMSSIRSGSERACCVRFPCRARLPRFFFRATRTLRFRWFFFLPNSDTSRPCTRGQFSAWHGIGQIGNQHPVIGHHAKTLYNDRQRGSRSGPSGRCVGAFRSRPRGGKSGLQRTRWWVTPTVREDRDSATEIRPPIGDSSESQEVRVKRCGKSAPANRVTGSAW